MATADPGGEQVAEAVGRCGMSTGARVQTATEPEALMYPLDTLAQPDVVIHRSVLVPSG
jgi:hypothetical protein